MKEIIDRLNENRQIELAKHILESNGYTVSKRRINESQEINVRSDGTMTAPEAIELFQNIKSTPEEYGYDDYPEMIDLIDYIINIFKKNPTAIYYPDIMAPDDYEFVEDIMDTGNDYLKKGTLIDEDGNEYSGYFEGNRDGMMNFIHIKK